jgi:diguanylate cyclase (GGDEF)-like protein
MSVRLKVRCIIIAIVVLITAVSMAVGIYFTQQYILKDAQSDVILISTIAQDLIAGKLNLLKESLERIGYELADYGKSGIIPEAKLRDLLQEYREASSYLSLTVLDAAGSAIASAGDPRFPPEYIQRDYARRALQGETVVSSTELDSGGEPVIRIGTPLLPGDRILVATLPGLIFSDMIAGFPIWQTGNIFILDREGVIIANIHTEAVLGRQNFIEAAKTDPAYQSVGDFTRRIIQGGRGEGVYTFQGIKCICAYQPVIGSEGWMLGAVAPISESPVNRMFFVLELSAVVVLGLGIVAALSVANRIAQSFERVNEQNKHLAELTQIANSASEVKSRFLASMSHEIRTPMNAILGMSELIRTDNFDADQHRYFMDIRKMTGVLLETINNILDFSKIETGELKLAEDNYNVLELYNHICSTSIFMAASKNLAFKSVFDPSLPEVLYGDELRVRQVITNVMNHAIQYTPEGYVSFKVGPLVNEGGAAIAFTVEHTGDPLKQEDFSNLCDPFREGEQYFSVNDMRLGFSIAKRLAALMGGDIQFGSGPEKSSVFTILLPLVTGDPQELLSSKSEEAAAAVRVMASDDVRILVVDDNKLNLKVAAGFLSRRLIAADTVQSGKEALERVQMYPYDLVFMDHMMDGMDGIETAKAIRALGYGVPIIALTANALNGARDFFLNAGMNDFLAKPIDSGALNKILRKWLPPEKISVADEEEPAKAPPDSPLEEPVIDRKAGVHNAADDEALYQQLLEDFKTDHGSDYQQIRDALAGNDLPRAHQLAHTLKSAAALIGALKLQSKALDLEQSLALEDWDKAQEELPGLAEALEAVGVELTQDRRANRRKIQVFDTPPFPKEAAETDAKYRVLAVDDEKSNLMVLCRILALEYTILTAKSGTEALNRAVKYHPDLILLDIIMPDINGFDVLVKLKESDETSHIPVIIITGLSSEDDEEKGFRLGAVDYITKPFKSDIVRARVNTHIQIIRHIRTIEKLGFMDGLTDIPNRRSFDDRIGIEWGRAMRDKRWLSFLMMDIDHFKTYNDTYGHPQGDMLLQTLARILSGEAKRSTDFVARMGGEEFGMLLPDTTHTGSMEVAEKVRSRIEAAQIPTVNGILTRVTISIGVVSVIPSEDMKLQDFIAKADASLYTAKKIGRNRICSA